MNGRTVFVKLTTIAAVAAIALSCGRMRPLRYMHPEFPIDTEWGYPGSQARMDVTGRIAASAAIRFDEEEEILRTVVTLTNVENGSIRVYIGGCPVQLQAFVNEKAEGMPVWDSFGPDDRRCPVEETFRLLDPREDYWIALELAPGRILGDSLPDGRYYFNAIVRPNGIRMDLPAGDVYLARAN
ncbi:MAG TPA: hypothetical protein VF190_15265 [Rhodothermales bacterium]